MGCFYMLTTVHPVCRYIFNVMLELGPLDLARVFARTAFEMVKIMQGSTTHVNRNCAKIAKAPRAF
ncbi:hypothetical protein M404DRAFT_999452 [Pisolithus tinctorius Marx 270]|uniref:Uncharacterized protein n=1 Tax=Pisolithus tinctorius Marx 270 TaxID=870435 RepID=A0A0C3PBA9_PISTI|nr:hypothetical protein M404DRAFT_999822 [Pisolithus tinctorius Marx 270]KIO06243.1 hypothetical protein M404DRAFT_999452 [Pisolithus tinctorius Marx 270]